MVEKYMGLAHYGSNLEKRRGKKYSGLRKLSPSQ
jgi:hypothetical protein